MPPGMEIIWNFLEAQCSPRTNRGRGGLVALDIPRGRSPSGVSCSFLLGKTKTRVAFRRSVCRASRGRKGWDSRRGPTRLGWSGCSWRTVRGWPYGLASVVAAFRSHAVYSELMMISAERSAEFAVRPSMADTTPVADGGAVSPPSRNAKTGAAGAAAMLVAVAGCR